jgi:hypothetical protein
MRCAMWLSELVGNRVLSGQPDTPAAELQARKTTGLADVLRQALQPWRSGHLVFGSTAAAAHAGKRRTYAAGGGPCQLCSRWKTPPRPNWAGDVTPAMSATEWATKQMSGNQ